mmetsp:Transcript_23584/g.66685  ORF Transcript_23584/g.66685 Transcript_23584/m.66685 type:complete len:519 (-) Transcript_23584:190-1746(-)
MELGAQVVKLQHGCKTRKRHGGSIDVKCIHKVHEVNKDLHADVRHADLGHLSPSGLRCACSRSSSVLFDLRLHEIVQGRRVDLENTAVHVEQLTLGASKADVGEHVCVDQCRKAVGERLVRLRHRKVVNPTAGDFENSLPLEACSDQRRCRLVRVAVAVDRHALTAAQAQLPTGARAPTVQVPHGRDGQGVRLATSDVDDALVGESIEDGGRRQVRNSVGVLANPRIFRIQYAELAAGIRAPTEKPPVAIDGQRVRVTAREPDDALQARNALRRWHVRAIVSVHGHRSDVFHAQLAVRAAAKGVDVAKIGERQCVHIAARCGDHPVLCQLLHLPWHGLEWVAVLVGGEAAGVRVAQLAAGAGAPGEHPASVGDGDGVSLAASYGGDDMRAKMLDDPRRELVRATILIFRHLRSLRMAKLATTAASPAEQDAFSGQGHRVRIPAGDLNDEGILENTHQQRHRLVGITLDVLGHMLSVAVAELPASTRTPAVELAMDGDRRGVAVSPSDLADLHPGECLN